MKDRETIFREVANLMSQQGFRIINEDLNRPWGGFYVIDEEQALQFSNHYFPGQIVEATPKKVRMSPKILMVAPKARLSWQYHDRRSELWKCIGGPAAIVTSDNNEEKDQQTIEINEILILPQGGRHRLVGLENWGIIAEIWQHTDPENPSDENDIVRVQDDYGR